MAVFEVVLEDNTTRENRIKKNKLTEIVFYGTYDVLYF